MQAPPSAPAPPATEQVGLGAPSTHGAQQPPTLPTLPMLSLLNGATEQARGASRGIQRSASYPEGLSATVVVVAAVVPPPPHPSSSHSHYPSSPPPSYADATQQQQQQPQLPVWSSPAAPLPYHIPPARVTSGQSYQNNRNPTTRNFTNYYSPFGEELATNIPPNNAERIRPQQIQPVRNVGESNHTSSKSTKYCLGLIIFLPVFLVLLFVIIKN